MYVYVVRTCIQCGTNVYLGGTKMGGTERRWYEKTGYQVTNWSGTAFGSALVTRLSSSFKLYEYPRGVSFSFCLGS